MCVIINQSPEHIKSVMEDSIPLKDLLDRIATDGQFTADNGLEFIRVLSSTMYTNKPIIFDPYLLGRRVQDPSVISFLVMIAKEGLGLEEQPRPLSTYVDLFALGDVSDESLVFISDEDAKILMNARDSRHETFMQNLLKVRDFKDLIIITRLIFGIK